MRVSVRGLVLWSLPPLLLGVVAAVTAYEVWRRSQILPLPTAADIQRVDFGINLGYTSTEWYPLPLVTGNALVDLFRDSVVMPPRHIDGPYDPLPDEYSVRIVDERGKECSLSFHAYSTEVEPNGYWTRYPIYVFPASRVPQLRKLVQSIFSPGGIAKGRYGYLPGEEDRIHYSRICNLILVDFYEKRLLDRTFVWEGPTAHEDRIPTLHAARNGVPRRSSRARATSRAARTNPLIPCRFTTRWPKLACPFIGFPTIGGGVIRRPSKNGGRRMPRRPWRGGQNIGNKLDCRQYSPASENGRSEHTGGRKVSELDGNRGRTLKIHFRAC